MSWNEVLNSYVRDSKGLVDYMYICGPDGSLWGQSSRTPAGINYAAIICRRKKPGCDANDTGSIKIADKAYFFMKEVDGYNIHNCSGKGLVVFHAATCTAIIAPSDDIKAELCLPQMDNLRKNGNF